MQVDGKTLSFDKSLWVQYGGVDVEEREGLRRVTGREEEAFLKVFNHFGRLLKLFTFEDGRWTDADTGGAPLPFDESQAGRLSVGTEATEAKEPAAAAGKPPAGKAPASSGANKQARTRAGKATAAGAARVGKTAPPRPPPAGRGGAKGGKARKAPPGPKAR